MKIENIVYNKMPRKKIKKIIIVDEERTCEVVLIKGPHKGEPCGRRVAKNEPENICFYHKNKLRKDRKKPTKIIIVDEDYLYNRLSKLTSRG